MYVPIVWRTSFACVSVWILAISLLLPLYYKYCSYGAHGLRVGGSKGYTRLGASWLGNGTAFRNASFKKKKTDVRRFMRKVRKPQILKRQILGGLIASLCIGVNMVITASTVSFVQAVLAERCHQWGFFGTLRHVTYCIACIVRSYTWTAEINYRYQLKLDELCILLPSVIHSQTLRQNGPLRVIVKHLAIA